MTNNISMDAKYICGSNFGTVSNYKGSRTICSILARSEYEQYERIKQIHAKLKLYR